MKAVLISIKPKWCELIASGKKTVEVRKTRPKLETPFKCYIYCTKGPKMQFWAGPRYAYADDHSHNTFDRCGNGKVIGEFVCTRIDRIGKRGMDNNFDYCYLSLDMFGNDDIEIEITDIKKSCIPKPQLNAYGMRSNVLFAWHISNLEIYPEPKELSEFSAICKYKNDDDTCQAEKVACPYQQYDFNQDGSINLVECGKEITRPPQSWCYVEDLDGDKEC